MNFKIYKYMINIIITIGIIIFNENKNEKTINHNKEK